MVLRGEFQAHPGAPSFWSQTVILSEVKNPSTGAEALCSSQATGQKIDIEKALLMTFVR